MSVHSSSGDSPDRDPQVSGPSGPELAPSPSTPNPEAASGPEPAPANTDAATPDAATPDAATPDAATPDVSAAERTDSDAPGSEPASTDAILLRNLRNLEEAYDRASAMSDRQLMRKLAIRLMED